MLRIIHGKFILTLLAYFIFQFTGIIYFQMEARANNVNHGQLEIITNAKLNEQSATVNGNRLFVYSWAEQEDAEIMIMHLPDKKKAIEEANRILLLIETGRTKGRKNADISSSFVGDYSIRPRKITDDPHGFAMKDSDKTFIIFTRNNIVVVIDSKLNFEPKIDVLGIARKIDNELLK